MHANRLLVSVCVFTIFFFRGCECVGPSPTPLPGFLDLPSLSLPLFSCPLSTLALRADRVQDMTELLRIDARMRQAASLAPLSLNTPMPSAARASASSDGGSALVAAAGAAGSAGAGAVASTAGAPPQQLPALQQPARARFTAAAAAVAAIPLTTFFSDAVALLHHISRARNARKRFASVVAAAASCANANASAAAAVAAAPTAPAANAAATTLARIS